MYLCCNHLTYYSQSKLSDLSNRCCWLVLFQIQSGLPTFWHYFILLKGKMYYFCILGMDSCVKIIILFRNLMKLIPFLPFENQQCISLFSIQNDKSADIEDNFQDVYFMYRNRHSETSCEIAIILYIQILCSTSTYTVYLSIFAPLKLEIFPLIFNCTTAYSRFIVLHSKTVYAIANYTHIVWTGYQIKVCCWYEQHIHKRNSGFQG